MSNKKLSPTFLCISKFDVKLGSWPNDFQNHTRGDGILKNGSQLHRPTVFFWGIILKIFFLLVRINLKRIYFFNFRRFNFLVNFFWSCPLPYSLPSGFSASLTTEARSAELSGWDEMGLSSKVSFNFLYIMWVYRKCICLLIFMFKNCHQHCHGFENLMPNWGVGIWFSKF